MRILQIGKFPKEFPGGVETAVFTLSEYLARKHYVKVVTSSLNSYDEEARCGNAECLYIGKTASLFSAPITPGMIKYLKNAKGFDIIQISWPNPMAIVAYLLARPKGKLVIWYHSDVVRQKCAMLFFTPLLRMALKTAARIVATSDSYIETSTILNDFRDKVISIPLGIDIGQFNKIQDKEGPAEIRKKYGDPLVLFLGRLSPYKGVEHLIKAMKTVEAKLLIIGSGILRSSLEQIAKKEGVKDKIFFRNVPQNEPTDKYIRACDIFVLPSINRAEAFGIAALEAMACGKPVITTELGTGTSFSCQNNVTGLIVAPKDAPALAQAINKLLSDPAMAKRFGEAGRKRVEELFTIEKMGEGFLRLYNNLIQHGKSE